ncbi:hypothetical protein [Limibacterium fermenti]|uniref:hypothetical protein n=1 Tax=Limibacterium fermenti TaxID=3229863 RepID=UPI002699A5EB
MKVKEGIAIGMRAFLQLWLESNEYYEKVSSIITYEEGKEYKVELKIKVKKLKTN